MITRHARERPKAFATAGPEAEAVAVEMMRLSAKHAKEASGAAVTIEDHLDVGKLAAASGKLAIDVRRVKQADDHHEDDLKVAQDNAKSNALSALAAVGKTYLGLNPGKV